MREDEDLRAILGDQALDSYPIAKELKRVKRVRQWFEKHIEKGGKDAWDYDVDIAHELVRFIKSVSVLYLDHLRRRRQVIASRPATSKSMLEAVDQQLARLEEKTQLGVFLTATPYPVVIDQLPQAEDKGEGSSPLLAHPLIFFRAVPVPKGFLLLPTVFALGREAARSDLYFSTFFHIVES
ncbi:MAG: hypothetical protein HYV00_02450 [Deltaproteobacteria bacterium]|nr:hypothetical protein [Deltaproteobacteria bacterium]